MAVYTKKSILLISVVIVLAGLSFFIFKSKKQAAVVEPSGDTFVFAGPPAAVSFPIAYGVATGEFNDLGKDVEFKIWMTPDQLRTLTLDGKTAVMAMPSNVAANLYNRNIDVQLINISTWGILYMISRDENKTRLVDYKNEEVAIPFRGDMPDVVFQILAKQQGLDAQKDFKIKYVSSPFDALQLLLTRRIDHVILPEPAVSMALRKSGSFPLKIIAPTLFRSLSLQKEWGQVFHREASMPQAGIVAVGDAAKDRAFIQKVNAGYERALIKCQANAVKCGEVIAPYFELLMPEAIADSLAASQLKVVPSEKARGELTYFYQKLYDQEPALLGGSMPPEQFYKWPK